MPEPISFPLNSRHAGDLAERPALCVADLRYRFLHEGALYAVAIAAESD